MKANLSCKQSFCVYLNHVVISSSFLYFMYVNRCTRAQNVLEFALEIQEIKENQNLRVGANITYVI